MAKLTLLRKPLCWLGLCQTYRTESDETGVWGECSLCGKRVGFVDRKTLRAFADAEYEREMAARALSASQGGKGEPAGDSGYRG